MMKWLAAVVLVGCCAGARGQTVCDRIKALVASPDVASAHWGVSVTTMDGQVICGVNDAQMFRPASNNKIFTTATALALMGADRRFTTRVVAEGELSKGVLKGDLRLVGGGDANFGGHDIPYVPPALRPKNSAAEPGTIADIEELADKVVKSGLKRVDGDVVGADTYFEWEPYPPDWTIDDALYGYGAPVSALTVHDNQIEVVVAPNVVRPGAGAPEALVSTIPAVPYYMLKHEVSTVAFEGGCDDRIGYERPMGSKRLTVFGDIAPGLPCRQDIAIADPAEYGALALRLALERRGVKISGGARAQHYNSQRLGPTIRDSGPHFQLPMLLNSGRPLSEMASTCMAQRVYMGKPVPVETVLATHEGPRLIDDIIYTMKVSQNLHAEIMMRNAGAAFSCEHTQSVGVTAVREYLLHAGVEPKDFLLFDGSGLSAHDLVAPRAFTTFLQFASTQPWFAQWKAALPEGGVDGTLNARFGKTLGGRVFAKTGTLSQTRALSGYVVNDAGTMMVFSVMVDTHLPMAGADRVVMDKIVEAVAAGK